MEPAGLNDYVDIIRKRLWLILLMLGLTLSVVIVRSTTATPMYSASVLLLVSNPGQDDVTMFGDYSSRPIREEISEAKNNFGDMVRSEAVARQTIKSLGLVASPSDLIDNLSVDTQSGSDFVVVSLKGESPDQTQAIVNAHVDNTLKYVGMLKSRPSAAMREFVSKRLAATSSELDATNAALRKFRSNNNIGDLNQEIISRQSVITSLDLQRQQSYASGNINLAWGFDKAINERVQELRNLSALSPEHDTLVARVRQLEDTYRFLLEKEAEAKLKEDQASTVGYIQIVELARRPEQPTSQRTATYAVMGGLVSVVAGVVLVFVWEYAVKLMAQNKQAAGSEKAIRLRKAWRPDEG